MLFTPRRFPDNIGEEAMRKVNKWVLAITALLIVTIVIACFVFMQKQGPVNRLFGRLSSFTVSSISIYSVARPLREVVLEEDDKNKLMELLRKEHYEGIDDPEFGSLIGGPRQIYSIRIQTKDGADILLTFDPKYCSCRPDEFDGNATSKSEVKGYKISKDGNDEHQQVMDFLADLLVKYFPDDKVNFPLYVEVGGA